MRALIALALLAACGDDAASLAPDAGADAAGSADANEGEDRPAVPAGCVDQRALADRPDDHGFDQIRVLYVLPADVADRGRDTNGQICNSMRAAATWFYDRAGAYLRFDTQDGLIDLGFVRLAKTDAELRGTDPNNTSITTGTAFVLTRIENELRAMGMIADNKLYAIFYEGSSVYACGGGSYPPIVPGRSGAVYLAGMPPGVTQPCGESRPWGQASLAPNYIDYAILHELVHSLGFVPQGAPNQHASGHVFDGASADPAADLMYSPRTSQDPPWHIDVPEGLVLDINHDDYFMTAPALDLAHSSLLAPLPAGAMRPAGW